MRTSAFFVLLLVMSSLVSAETMNTRQFCTDSDTLYAEQYTETFENGTKTTYNTTKEISCEDGCIGGKCAAGGYPVGIYIFMCCVSVFLMALSSIFNSKRFFDEYPIIVPWISFLFLASTAVMTSGAADFSCGFEGCSSSAFEMSPLIYLWSGLSIIMLIYALSKTLTWSGKTVSTIPRTDRFD